MKENEERYFKSISILSNFNSHAGVLASQISALNGAAYPSVLASTINSAFDQYKTINSGVNLLPKLDPSIFSPLTGIARDANLAISRLTTNENVMGLASIVSSKPDSYLNGIDSLHSLSSPPGIAQTVLQSANATLGIGSQSANATLGIGSHSANAILGIESHFSKLSATSILAESALSAFKWNDLGIQVGIGQSNRAILSNSFVAVSKSYSDFFRSIQDMPQSIIDINPCIIRRTPIEYYTGAALCRIISTPDKLINEKELIDNKILIDNKTGLARNLPRIDSDLLRLWNGANQALTSDNPDRIRHFSTSVRELITTVLHQLSPDDEVKKWSSNPIYYKDNQPTRKARLMYICRDINLGHFQEFVEKDVAATIEFINLFQEGTHKVKPSFTEKQLLALNTKAESTLNFLLELGLGDQ